MPDTQLTHIEKIEAYEDLIEDLLDGLDPSEPLTDEYHDRFHNIKDR